MKEGREEESKKKPLPSLGQKGRFFRGTRFKKKKKKVFRFSVFAFGVLITICVAGGDDRDGDNGDWNKMIACIKCHTKMMSLRVLGKSPSRTGGSD
jgi:hypothetical protein